jgi:hypothetical protein
MLISLSAIRISDYKKWGAKFNKNLYKNIFQKYTKKKNAYRIYLPVGEHYVEAKTRPLPEIVAAVEELGYVIEDYSAGLAIKADKSKKNPVRIGKLLNKSPALLEKYAKHKLSLGISGVSDLVVVISRHPYDIMGMSTDRGWTSCTDLALPSVQYVGKDRVRKRQDGPGVNSRYVITDVAAGNIIAYLVDKTDLNIRRPKARVRIITYVNKETNDFVLRAHDVVYGTNSPAFIRVVDKWLDEVNEVDTEGLYCAIDNMDEQDGAESLYIVKSTQSILEALNKKPTPNNNNLLENLLSTTVNSKYITEEVIDRLIELAKNGGDDSLLLSCAKLPITSSLLEYIYNNAKENSTDYALHYLYDVLLESKHCSYALLHRIVNDVNNLGLEDFHGSGFFFAVLNHIESDEPILRTLIHIYGDDEIESRYADAILNSRKLSEDAIRELFIGDPSTLARNDNTPLSILRELLTNPATHSSIKLDVLENPNLSVDLVRTYALQSGNAKLIDIAAANPKLNSDDLSFILQNGNERTKLRVFKHPKVQPAHVLAGLNSDSTKMRIAAASSPAITPSIINSLLSKDNRGNNKRLKIAALSSGKANPENIKKALADDNEEVVIAVISHCELSKEQMLLVAKTANFNNSQLILVEKQRLSREVIDVLVEQAEDKVLKILANRSDLSASHITNLIERGSPETVGNLIENEDLTLSDSHFEAMSASPFKEVRKMAAGHFKTPSHVLSKLMFDPEVTVRKEVANSANVPGAALSRALLNESDDDVTGDILRSNNLPLSAWKTKVKFLIDSVGDFAKDFDAEDFEFSDEDADIGDKLTAIEWAFQNVKIPESTKASFITTIRSPNALASVLSRPSQISHISDASIRAILDNKNIDLTSKFVSTLIGGSFRGALQKNKLKPDTLTRVLKETGPALQKGVPGAKSVTKEHISMFISMLDGNDMEKWEEDYAYNVDSSLVNSAAFSKEHVAPIIAALGVNADALEQLEDWVVRSRGAAVGMFAAHYFNNPPPFLTDFNIIFRVYHKQDPVPDSLKQAFYSSSLESRVRARKVEMKRRASGPSGRPTRAERVARLGTGGGPGVYSEPGEEEFT